MKLLVDTCLSRHVVQALISDGNDARWVPDVFHGDPGDAAIIDWALENGCVLITGDKDFGDLVFLHQKQHAGIVRLEAMRPLSQVDVVRRVLRNYEAEIQRGAILTASTVRIRIREYRR